MTRISDLGLQQILLSGFQRAQDASQARQIQLSTGKVSNTYSGIGPQTNRLLSAEGVVSRVTAYESAANAALSRLQIQEGAITTLSEAVTELRNAYVATLANGAAEQLPPTVDAAAQRVLSALNAQAGGVFVFGGTDGATAPISAQSLDDLGAVSDVARLFADGERVQLAIEAGAAIDGGPLASEIGLETTAALQAFAEAEASLGGFSGALSDDQRDFLVAQVAVLETIADNLNTELGLNGVGQGQAAAAVDRGQRARDLAEVVAAEIEDADIAEVVSRLNQDQLAIQASAQALSQATQLSLLNFL